jgi:esterase/lipase
MSSELEIKRGSDTLVVSFGGSSLKFAHIPPFEFLNFISKNFTDVDCSFYIDKHKCFYTKGIDGISKDEDETIEYLKDKIKGYKKVIFLGISAGGYAALLFGSKLNVDKVLVWGAPTLLEQGKYKDLVPVINDTTQYFMRSLRSTMEIHSTEFTKRIEALNKPNVSVNYNKEKPKEMRSDGRLFKVLNEIING